MENNTPFQQFVKSFEVVESGYSRIRRIHREGQVPSACSDALPVAALNMKLH
jgi:hypothetical protein